MKCSRSILVSAFLLLCFTPLFAHHLAVIVDKDNSVSGMTHAHLAKIFRSEVKKWPDGKDIVIVLHQDAPGEMLTLERLTNMSARELLERIGHEHGITQVNSDADVLRVVGSVPGAVGLVDVREINDHVRVVKVGGKLPLEAGYLPHQ